MSDRIIILLTVYIYKQRLDVEGFVEEVSFNKFIKRVERRGLRTLDGTEL